MRREDTIKQELKKLHTVYIAPYYYDSGVELDTIASSTAFKTRKAARKHVKQMLGILLKDTDDYIVKLDFEF